MVDSASYSACGQQAGIQRHRRARANEHVVASNFLEGGATARRQNRMRSENVTGQAGQTVGEVGISQAGPGLRP